MKSIFDTTYSSVWMKHFDKFRMFVIQLIFHWHYFFFYFGKTWIDKKYHRKCQKNRCSGKKLSFELPLAMLICQLLSKPRFQHCRRVPKMAKNKFIFLNGIFWHCKFCHNRKNHFFSLCNAMLRCNYQEKYLFTLLISLDTNRFCNKTQWMPHIPSAGSICSFWVQIG